MGISEPRAGLDDRLRVLSGALRAFAEATTDFERLLEVIAETVAGVVADGCIVRLLGADGWLSPSAVRLPFEKFVSDPGAVGRARAFLSAPQRVADYAWGVRLMETGEAFLAERIDPATLTPEIAEIYASIGVHSLLVTVMRVRGESIGTLAMFRMDPASPPFGPPDLDLAQALSDHAALAINNARLLRSARRELAERERAEATLRKTEEQLLHAQKMEAVGRLAGGVAHDFNNVLSVVLSYAQMIRDDLPPGALHRAEVDEIRKAGLRGSDLTRQLLAFSRHQALEPKVLNLNESIAEMDTMLRRLLGADVELTTLLSPGPWSVKADPGSIEQVVLNLAINARDAMPGGGMLTIETRNVELGEDYAAAHHDVAPGAYVLLAVSDSGVGMDRATRTRIFEPFFTTKEKGKGTGLGLSTVFGIVKQSGGHVGVYSEPGQGATFKVYLPRVAGAPAAKTSDRPDARPARSHETVLLVDDDDQVRRVARSILRRSGYVVLEASNGGEALLLADQHTATIHLLLTDVVLPRMSGRQIAERVAVKRPGIQVLFMSGYTDEAVLQHGILESNVAYLQKPFTPDSLARKVREVLDAADGTTTA